RGGARKGHPPHTRLRSASEVHSWTSVRRDGREHRLAQEVGRKQPLREDRVVKALRREALSKPGFCVTAQLRQLEIAEEVRGGLRGGPERVAVHLRLREGRGKPDL